MAFHGVFIGIDRYASPYVTWLSGAKRDAIALEALFHDTLGGTTTALLDENATRAAIEAEFTRLRVCDPGDTVVISFSGHGSPTHELITYDADPARLTDTAIPLDLLTEWFKRIPAERVVLFLDCCFSGGAGARVLQPDVVPRGLLSAEVELGQISGAGRLILTASSANQPAWENPRTGHGYFTHYLLEALQGAEEVEENGRLPVYRLLEYVSRRVIQATSQYGHHQHPTLRGTIDQELSWPIFVPATRYLSAFPDRAGYKATEDVTSLVTFGFPDALIASWAQSITHLNALQIAAINDFGLFSGEHLTVVAPTSSGKTMIGELAAVKGLTEGKRALFLLPLKALVADKRRQFTETYGGFGIQIVEATGETDDISPLLRGQYDIGLLTYEKFAAIAVTFPHVLEQVSVIVVDEAQMIADATRGANLEFLLTVIRMRRLEGVEPQVIALSGVIGDTGGFENWLGGRLLRRDQRPVPLDEGLILWDGRHQYVDAATGDTKVIGPIVRRAFSGKQSSQDLIIPLVSQLMARNEQVIVFRETRGKARGCAKYLAKALGLEAAVAALDRLPQGDSSQASSDLRDALSGGVAFHISDLDREERRVIEEEFRRPGTTLRVVVATTTLAMGVNTPASSVVIAGLSHPGGQPYSVAEYKNLVGRAGRLGYAEHGTSYLVAMSPHDAGDLWRRYVTAPLENLSSRFFVGTDLRSMIVRVLAASSHLQTAGTWGMRAEEISDFLTSSFGAHQQRVRLGAVNWGPDDVTLATRELAQHGLIDLSADGRFELTPLGRLAGESGTEVASVVRIVRSLRSLSPTEITDPTLIGAAQFTVELDQLYLPLNKRTPKEAQSWLAELTSQHVPRSVLTTFGSEASSPTDQAMRAKRAVACLAYVGGQPMADIEKLMARHGGGFDGASGPVRAVASRTSDLLPTVARVAEILHPSVDLVSRVERLCIRLTLGVPSEMVELARYAGTSLTRGDYLRLGARGLSTPAKIDAAEDEILLQLLDGDRGRLVSLRHAASIAGATDQSASTVSKVTLQPYLA